MKISVKHLLFVCVIISVLIQTSSVNGQKTPDKPAASANLSTWECWDDGSVNPCHKDLNAVEMLTPNEGWAVGNDRLILHWNGSVWNRVEDEPPTFGGGNLTSVSVVSSTDVWMTRLWDGFLHWDGSNITEISLGLDITLNSLDMTSSTNGWAVGNDGKILRWNGTDWQLTSSPTTQDLLSISMLNANYGWIVGEDGLILQWNGVVWLAKTSPTVFSLSSVSILAENMAIAVDGNNLIYWDGTQWIIAVVNHSGYMRATAISSPTNAWVGGGNLLAHYDGNVLETYEPLTKDINDFSIVSDNDAWAVGRGGAIMHWNGVDWQLVTPQQPVELLSIKMLDAQHGWAVGEYGTLMVWNGNTWEKSGLPEKDLFSSIDALTPNDVWAVSNNNIDHWDGVDWTEHTPQNTLNVVHMVTPTDVWAGGWGIYHWDGIEWTRVYEPSQDFIQGIDMINATNGWAITYNGTILHWNGVAWQIVSSTVIDTLNDIEMNGPNDGWVVGLKTILRWDGSEWKDATIFESTPNLYGVSIVSTNDVWAAGSNGAFIHWNGTDWTDRTLIHNSVHLYALDMDNSSEGWAVGNGGVIVRYIPQPSVFLPLIMR